MSALPKTTPSTRCRKRDVTAVVTNVLGIRVVMPCEDAVFAILQQTFYLKPIGMNLSPPIPKRLVNEDDCPAYIRVIGQRASHPVHLRGWGVWPWNRMTGLAHHAEEFTVQRQDEHVLMDKLVVG